MVVNDSFREGWPYRRKNLLDETGTFTTALCTHRVQVMERSASGKLVPQKDNMKYLSLIIMASLAACNSHELQSKDSTQLTVFVSHDTIPDIRNEVSRKPVASYRVPVGAPKLGREFGVSIYETPFTFKYLLKMQYEAMEETDTLKIPNFGSWPIVEVHPGKDKLSCIIGFLDEKKNFKEYKMLSAKGNKMSLTVLKKWGVGRYRTVFK